MIHRNASVSLALDRESATPYFRQIYERFRDAIGRGLLRPGERLPSARSLAQQLATARGTVDLAYGLLSAEGYLVSQGAAGTFVSLELEGHLAHRPTKRRGERTPHSESNSANAPAVRPFQMGLPALDAFPRKLWSRLAARRARDFSDATMIAPDPVGHPFLREAIASYLAIARGIVCSPEQVIVTAGYQGALGLITRTLLSAGDAVWLEEPGYFLARQGLEAAGARLVPVAVDSEGLDVEAGIGLARGARFAVVTPSHHAPLGVALSLPRRLALLSWAEATGAWIVEDDYDGEFRYGGRPLPALKSLDRVGRVLYAGSFSKVLFPGLRLGYLVVPESQIATFRRICELLYRDRPNLGQLVVADFMREGHFSRHIRRMRGLYAARRAALAAALGEAFGDRIAVELRAGGMHLLAHVARREGDRALVRRAEAHGLAPAALSSWYMTRNVRTALLLSFTNIPESDADLVASRLRRALDG
jgi:GntR family transcriptional regulator/MocR family aminotransferase